MKKFFSEFKTFITRGNVLDMAIGVIIATSFGKITTTLVNNVIMPFIGWIFGGADAIEALNVVVRQGTLNPETGELQGQIVIGFGTLISVILDFIIVAFIVFCIVKAFNKAKEKAEAKKKAEEAAAAAAAAAAPAPEPEPTKEELLLAEIRDLLKNK